MEALLLEALGMGALGIGALGMGIIMGALLEIILRVILGALLLGALLLGLNFVGKVRIELAFESYSRMVILLFNIILRIIGMIGLAYRVSISITSWSRIFGGYRSAYIGLGNLLLL